MRRSLPSLVVPIALVVACAGTAHAGMPQVTLSDLASARVDTISFFLVAFLLCALAIQLLWNFLRNDFPRLPRLSYGKAVGLTALWGLLFVVVLTMISGARELLTPGAWKKDGHTYKLTDAPPDGADRTRRLENLRDVLWGYAKTHGGSLPPAGAKEIPDDRWRVLDHPDAARFVYVGGAVGSGGSPVAWEPHLYGAKRYALLASGDVVLKDASELSQGAR